MLKGLLDVGNMLGLRLIVPSGWVVFSGYRTTNLRADETLPPRSKGSYGDAKLLEETLLEAYLRRGEVDAVLCRFSPVYGPGGDRPRLIRTFAEAISNGRKVVTHRYRNGTPALDLLHIDDAVSALATVLQSDATGTFHFGTGRLTETPTVARHLSSLLGAPLEHEEMAIDDETSNIAMDAAKALLQLGWEAKISVEDGLATWCAALEQAAPNPPPSLLNGERGAVRFNGKVFHAGSEDPNRERPALRREDRRLFRGKPGRGFGQASQFFQIRTAPGIGDVARQERNI